ncbi:MAG: DUF4034 domain-containing protein [Nitrospira sp.]|nr:MAG: DUF4034 domain-containing protein [Nitrospira sp.]
MLTLVVKQPYARTSSATRVFKRQLVLSDPRFLIGFSPRGVSVLPPLYFHNGIRRLKMKISALLVIIGLPYVLSIAPTLATPESATIGVTTSTEDKSIFSNIEHEAHLLSLLRAGDFVALESATRQIQGKFEIGSLSDIELRNTYRQFLKIDTQDLARIEEWKNTVPDSYAAHLIPGVYFKRKGFDVRGDKSISQTPQENINKMRQYHKIARTELERSLELTKKPFLSIFHLLDIARSEGSKEDSWALIAAANKMLPSNSLARNRFMDSLSPRWGGSYEEMRQFISRSKDEGVSMIGLIQLEAIMYDDMAETYLARGDRQSAAKYYDRAVELAERVGGDFRKDWLPFSYTRCAQGLETRKYC